MCNLTNMSNGPKRINYHHPPPPPIHLGQPSSLPRGCQAWLKRKSSNSKSRFSDSSIMSMTITQTVQINKQSFYLVFFQCIGMIRLERHPQTLTLSFYSNESSLKWVHREDLLKQTSTHTTTTLV